MSVTLHCKSAPFVRCRKKLKFRFDGGDSGGKKCKQGKGGAYGGVRHSLRLAGVRSLESGGQICVDAFGSNLSSHAVKMFSHFGLIYFINCIMYFQCDLQR
jgi:hypothetical protein